MIELRLAFKQEFRNGTSVTLKGQVSASEPSDGSWSGATTYLTKSSITATGGNLAFLPGDWNAAGIDDLTIKSDADNNGSFETTEVVERFDVDANRYTEETLTYDSNGNLTYDGLQAYTYDAWNRLKTVAHAYRDGSGVHSGRVFATMGYDAAGRRVTKAISGTGVDDCTYNYYQSGNSVVEERNGSDQRIKDHIWGLSYIDEAVQTRVNTNLSSPSWTGYWHLQDANFNELGVVNGSGSLVERYEYAAYGARSVYTSAGSNDPGCYAPSFGSRKVVIGGANQPWGINEIGHQGLLHDEPSGLVYNRARHLHPGLGRFMQVDPLGYVDTPSLYLYLENSPIQYFDQTGLSPNVPPEELQKLLQMGEDAMKQWIKQHPEWAREAYNWLRKNDMKQAQAFQKAQKFAKVRNIPKRTGGAKPKGWKKPGIGIIGIAFTIFTMDSTCYAPIIPEKTPEERLRDSLDEVDTCVCKQTRVTEARTWEVISTKVGVFPFYETIQSYVLEEDWHGFAAADTGATRNMGRISKYECMEKCASLPQSGWSDYHSSLVYDDLIKMDTRSRTLWVPDWPRLAPWQLDPDDF